VNSFLTAHQHKTEHANVTTDQRPLWMNWD